MAKLRLAGKDRADLVRRLNSNCSLIPLFGVPADLRDFTG